MAASDPQLPPAEILALSTPDSVFSLTLSPNHTTSTSRGLMECNVTPFIHSSFINEQY